MKQFIIVYFISLLLHACGGGRQTSEAVDKKANRLINESSPYLLQHAYNPVEWNPWGDEALEQAKKEDKLLVISVGYAACHWCHVMEHESFEDSAVAVAMNQSFVSIKVDREERPDIDQIYMQAAYLTNQSGGWPLNVIALPDGRPVYAGTYFPKDQWLKILAFFADTYQNDREKLETQGEQYQLGINQIEAPELVDSSRLVFSEDAYLSYGRSLIGNMDTKLGGRKGAPKFPMPSVLTFLNEYYYYTKEASAAEVLNTSLEQMARGGIYDQIGGGFARYSTDASWTVPHFEKMLYDNAQLISVYSSAFRQFKRDEYKKVVYQTYDFLQRDLSDKYGGFYSSLDADSEGEEGKFYVWNKGAIERIASDDAPVMNYYYGVTASGNFEGKNILTRRRSLETTADKFGLTISELEQKISAFNTLLLAERRKRIAPGLDDKVLTSWNALAVVGLLDAYAAFEDEKFLKRAKKCLDFIVKYQLGNDGLLKRNFKEGRSSINAFHDDYALTIQAMISMYEATFEEKWLLKANELKVYVRENFFEPEQGYYYYTSGLDTKLIARKMELSDNVIPGANSVMAEVLFKLGHYFYNQDDITLAKRMLKSMEPSLEQSPNFYSNWLQLYGKASHRFYEVAIVGGKAFEFRQEISLTYIPNTLLVGGKEEGELTLLQNKAVPGKTRIYVCEDKACKLPVEEVASALTFVSKTSY